MTVLQLFSYILFGFIYHNIQINLDDISVKR